MQKLLTMVKNGRKEHSKSLQRKLQGGAMSENSIISEELDSFARGIGLSNTSKLVGEQRAEVFTDYIDVNNDLLLDTSVLDKDSFPMNEIEAIKLCNVSSLKSEPDSSGAYAASYEISLDDDDVTGIINSYATMLQRSQDRINETKRLCRNKHDFNAFLLICLNGFDTEFLLHSASMIQKLFQGNYNLIDGVVLCILMDNSVIRKQNDKYCIATSITRFDIEYKKQLCIRLGDLWKQFHDAGGHNRSRGIDVMEKHLGIEEVPKLLKLNYESFNNTYKKNYNDLGIDPVVVFQTSIALPFHVPLSHNHDFTFVIDNDSLVTIMFHSVDLVEKIYADVEMETTFKIDVSKSIIEMVYATKDKSTTLVDRDVEEMSKVFDKCLEVLNYLIVSFQVTYKDQSVYRVTLPMLEPCCLCRIVNPESWEMDKVLLLLNQNVPFIKPIISLAETQAVVHYANVLKQNWNPFILSSELIVNADRNLAIGQYREAVINIQSGFESFIMILAQELNKADNLSLTDLESRFIQNGLTYILKSEFHNRLGGYWDVKDKSKPIGQWYAICYELRNKVVHTGYMPTHSETDLAFIACKNFIQEIIACVKTNKKKYPTISRYFVVSIVDSKGEVIQHAQDVIFGLSQDITDKSDKTQATKDKT